MSEQRPLVGIGVLVMNGDKVLLGLRKNAHGENMWAAAGGHLEFGESFEDCALREVAEETGLAIANVRLGTVTNDVFDDHGKHYVTVFMVADYAGGEPEILEPEKCTEWKWFPWAELPDNLFLPIAHAVEAGFSPLAAAGNENAEMQRLRELAARAQADLQNAKARVEREAADIRKFAAEQIIKKILPTLDNFQRAFQHIPADLQKADWVKGVTAIEQDLMKQMADAGLTRMRSLGEVADPARHEILMLGPGEEGKVVEVLEEGYELNGRVLRPAKVKAGDGTK
jgi:8-oxo-dGTP diphosphatase